MASDQRTSDASPLHLEHPARAANLPLTSPCHAAPVELARGVGATYPACAECGLEVKPDPGLAAARELTVLREMAAAEPVEGRDFVRMPAPELISGRRGFLLGGVAAAAAAAMPSPVLAAGAPLGDALEPAREEYRRRIERIAVELRPRFVSGELHGFNDADERADQADRARQAPIRRLEKELEAAHLPSFADAYLVLACSESEPLLDGGMALADAKSGAAEAMALDLLRIARRRGWYRPDASEEPTRERLGA